MHFEFSKFGMLHLAMDMALLLDAVANWMVALVLPQPWLHRRCRHPGLLQDPTVSSLVGSPLSSVSLPIVLVAWPVSQACLPTAAVLVLELVMKFYAGHCLLLLLALVNYSVKNQLGNS
jgi:hypothetical protein